MKINKLHFTFSILILEQIISKHAPGLKIYALKENCSLVPVIILYAVAIFSFKKLFVDFEIKRKNKINAYNLFRELTT